MAKKYQKFRNYLLEQLKNSEDAKEFFNIAIHEYEEDNDIQAFMLALRYLVEAQEGVGYGRKQSH